MTYRITPTRDYCNENALSYPDFEMVGGHGFGLNSFETPADAAFATIELPDDVSWEVVEVA